MAKQSVQQTFEDLGTRQFVKKLTPVQINIIRFLEQGYYGSYIARRLKVTKGYVSQTIKALESHGLIAPGVIEIEYKGKTRRIARSDPLQGRATTYTVSEKLQNLLKRETPQSCGSFTLCTPHHIKIKYPIISFTGDWCCDGWQRSRTRTIYIRSWKPKGPERHLWHVNTKNGVIGIEYHGKSIIAYRCERDHIMAESIEEATGIVATHIQEGLDIWLKEQRMAGVRVSLGSAETISRPHYAFESNLAKKIIEAGAGITVPGMFIDNSPEDHGNPHVSDIETTSPVIANMVDLGLRNAMNIEGIVEQKVTTALTTAIPVLVESVNGRLDDIQDDINNISNQMNEGVTVSHQFTQLVDLLNNTIKELETIKNGPPAPPAATAPVLAESDSLMYQ